MNEQDFWFDLCRTHGEKEARRLLIVKLRDFADLIEKQSYPDVFGCKIEFPGKKPCEKSTDDWHLMESISVTLSHLWPG